MVWYPDLSHVPQLQTYCTNPRAISGPLFTRGTNVLPQDLVQSRSREIGCCKGRITPTFDRHPEVPGKFQTDWKSLNPNLAAPRYFTRSCGKTSIRLMNKGPGYGYLSATGAITKNTEKKTKKNDAQNYEYVIWYKVRSHQRIGVWNHRQLDWLFNSLFRLNGRRHQSTTSWQGKAFHIYCSDVIMGTMASQITSLTIVYSTINSGADQRKYQSSASLAFVRGIHRWPVNSPHKWPVMRRMSPFDDVIMFFVLCDDRPSLTANWIPLTEGQWCGSMLWRYHLLLWMLLITWRQKQYVSILVNFHLNHC